MKIAIRSDLNANTVPVILTLTLWLFCLIVYVLRPAFLQYFLCMTFFAALIVYYLLSFEIIFYESFFKYKSPFGKTKTMRYEAVECWL